MKRLRRIAYRTLCLMAALTCIGGLAIWALSYTSFIEINIHSADLANAIYRLHTAHGDFDRGNLSVEITAQLYVRPPMAGSPRSNDLNRDWPRRRDDTDWAGLRKFFGDNLRDARRPAVRIAWRTPWVPPAVRGRWLGFDGKHDVWTSQWITYHTYHASSHSGPSRSSPASRRLAFGASGTNSRAATANHAGIVLREMSPASARNAGRQSQRGPSQLSKVQ
jgi:hypothetical protein